MSKKVSFVIPAINEYPAVYLTLNNLQVEMVDSKWYQQVTNRADRLVQRMRNVK